MKARDITLVSPSLAMLDAAIAPDPALLGQLLEAEIAEGWAVFFEALPRLRSSLAESPTPEWGSVLFLLSEPRTLVGLGGYKGGPEADGTVEIGYAVAPAHRNRGLATRAATKLIARAFADPRVQAVRAHTLQEENASVRVLRKLGFERDVPTEGGDVWGFRLTRDRWSPT